MFCTAFSGEENFSREYVISLLQNGHVIDSFLFTFPAI